MDRLLSNISWNIHEELDAVKRFVENDDDCVYLDMTDKDWNAIVIPVRFPRIMMDQFAFVIVDVGRFDSFKRVARVKMPCTVRDVLKGIRDIYQAPITESEVNEHEDDGYGYRNTALQRLGQGKVVKVHEMNGDRAHFEGLRKLFGGTDTLFEVLLGS